ncbi:MAG TPA: SRPBCC family protein [Actinospica sp.]|jgi:carbon monoxide dehydrogenase subunit G|nr:SRPBCC family protein [Actinospica sp.]
MAIRHILVERDSDAVWAVLSDPEKFSAWVPGTVRTAAGSGMWPHAGASLVFKVGVGRLTMRGRTVVRISEPPHRLELEAFLDPLGSARIAVRLIPWGEQTLVVIDEHPLRGPAAALHIAPMEVLLQLRHRRMLSRLAAAVEGASAVTRSAAGSR